MMAPLGPTCRVTMCDMAARLLYTLQCRGAVTELMLGKLRPMK